MRLGPLLLWLSLAATLAACGSKSQLKYKRPRHFADAGIDATVIDGGDGDGGDLGIDGMQPDGGDMLMPPVITAQCDRRDIYTSPNRQAVIVSAFTATEPIPNADQTLFGPGSVELNIDTQQPVPTELTHTLLASPSAVGDYDISVFATTVGGERASCEYVLHVIVGPPVAICPEDQPLVTRINEPLMIIGDAFDDVGVTSVQWTTSMQPPGSAVTLEPVDELQTVFTANMRGDYSLLLRVADADAASDECVTQVRVTEPPMVMCPGGTLTASSRRPFTITASATDDFGVESTRWALIAKPAASRLDIGMPMGTSLTFTPDVVGMYTFEFTAVDADGLSSSCTIMVNVVPSPPDAICPDTIRTTPLSTVRLRGAAVTDRPITRYVWDLAGVPAGSSSMQPAPRPGQEVTFTPDVAGEYRLRLTVTDMSGAMATCETLVLAENVEGLRVEMFWNPPDRSCDTHSGMCDATDVDLHLLDIGGRFWSQSPDDCYFGNCTGGIEWGAPGFPDNARLDIDDTRGFGPENINIETPRPGTYRIGVHFYASHFGGPGGGAFSSAVVTVNVYCGAGSVAPAGTFGPVVLRGDDAQPERNDFWRVADVTIGSGACRLTDLSRAGRPDVRPASDRNR